MKKLKRYTKKVWELMQLPLKKHTWLFFFSYLLSVLLPLLGSCYGVQTGLFLPCFLSLFSCYLFCVLVTLLGHIRLAWLGYIVVLLPLVVELFTLFIYHSLFCINVVQLILETDARESSEFLLSVLTGSSLWLVLLSMAVVGGLSWLFTWMVRRLRFSYVVQALVFVIISWAGARQMSTYKKLWMTYCARTVSECADVVPHMTTPLVRFFYGVAFNHVATKEMDVLEASVRRLGAQSTGTGCPLIVLVIGESFSKYHTPLYVADYRPVSPNLTKLRDQGNLVVFTDAVAPFNVTSNVFKRLFSTWDDSCSDDWTQHTLFTALFRKAGYEVCFFTNQFVYNSNDNYDGLGGTIFNQSGLSRLQFSRRNKQKHDYDMELLDELPSIDSLTQHPTLLIVHLIGQHAKYAERYPASETHFRASDVTANFGGESGRQTVAEYDNATYYNDKVVGRLLNLFRSEDAIAFYLSDHGEEVLDWRDYFCRSNEENLSREVARYQYEVPLLCCMTDTFQARRPALADSIRAAASRPILSSDLSNVLLHLGGISTDEYQAQHDFISEKYDKQRKRIIRGDIDYDALMKEQ
ncbi:MAG: phosphoethanolamine transferase [Bacteroidales bacterium]|nr:phosphoethanolamine transferase [Candidatus Physcousia equi]